MNRRQQAMNQLEESLFILPKKLLCKTSDQKQRFVLKQTMGNGLVKQLKVKEGGPFETDKINITELEENKTKHPLINSFNP